MFEHRTPNIIFGSTGPDDISVDKIRGNVIVRVFVMLGKYFVSVKYVFVCIKLVCVM
jgi:hypothetical protein